MKLASELPGGKPKISDLSELDELEDVIWMHLVEDGIPQAESAASAILAAGWHKHRTIATDAALDLLPEKTTIVDSDGDAWQKRDGWREIDNEEAPHRGRFPSLPAVCVWNGGDNE